MTVHVPKRPRVGDVASTSLRGGHHSTGWHGTTNKNTMRRTAVFKKRKQQPQHKCLSPMSPAMNGPWRCQRGSASEQKMMWPKRPAWSTRTLEAGLFIIFSKTHFWHILKKHFVGFKVDSFETHFKWRSKPWFPLRTPWTVTVHVPLPKRPRVGDVAARRTPLQRLAWHN